MTTTGFARWGRRQRLAAVVIMGLTLPSIGHAASFDCARARTADEHAICNNRALNDKDVQLATTLKIALELVAMGQRGELLDQEQTWLEHRRTCADNLVCLTRSYDQRLKEVQSVIDAIQSAGPY